MGCVPIFLYPIFLKFLLDSRLSLISFEFLSITARKIGWCRYFLVFWICLGLGNYNLGFN
jgi:hypothetical protein